jgi:hypothetical protein
LTDLGGEFRHGRLILVDVRPKNDASNGVFFKGRGAQHAAETKNKSERREVSKNEERKEGRGKDQKEGEMLYYHLKPPCFNRFFWQV